MGENICSPLNSCPVCALNDRLDYSLPVDNHYLCSESAGLFYHSRDKRRRHMSNFSSCKHSDGQMDTQAIDYLYDPGYYQVDIRLVHVVGNCNGAVTQCNCAPDKFSRNKFSVAE